MGNRDFPSQNQPCMSGRALRSRPWGRWEVGSQARGVPEAERGTFRGTFRGSVTSHDVERYSMVGTEDHPLDSATVTTLDRSVPAEQRGQKPAGSERGHGLLESQEHERTSPEFCRCTTSGAWVTFFLSLRLHSVMSSPCRTSFLP